MCDQNQKRALLLFTRLRGLVQFGINPNSGLNPGHVICIARFFAECPNKGHFSYTN